MSRATISSSTASASAASGARMFTTGTLRGNREHQVSARSRSRSDRALEHLAGALAQKPDRGHVVQVRRDHAAPAAVLRSSSNDAIGIVRLSLVTSSPLVTRSRCAGSTVTSIQEGAPW